MQLVYRERDGCNSPGSLAYEPAFKASVTSLQAGVSEVATTSSPIYFCISYCFSVQQQTGITSVLTEVLEEQCI